MSRTWDELAAAAFDIIGARQLLLLMLLTAGVCAALWYWYPAWVPRGLPRWRLRSSRLRPPRLRLPKLRLPRLRLPRLRLPRWDWRRLLRRRPRPARTPRAAAPATEPAPVSSPAAHTGGLSPADRLAAQGRYAEAIRERLREAVGDLIDAGVVAPQPGWTAAELAAAAATSRPAVAYPLDDATALFSQIWYGQRPAQAVHDQRMRQLTGAVRAALHDTRAGVR